MKKSVFQECLRIAQNFCHPTKHPQYFNYIHYSFVIQGNKIIEWGMNRAGDGDKRWYNGYPKKIHSEYDAFSKARGILDKGKNFEILNIRLGRRGDLKLSKPCGCCLNFLKQSKCERIWFSTEFGFAKMSLDF